jgi:hypothetical protein
MNNKAFPSAFIFLGLHYALMIKAFKDLKKLFSDLKVHLTFVVSVIHLKSFALEYLHLF